MNVVSFTHVQIQELIGLCSVLFAGIVYIAVYCGWQRGFARGFKMGEEWSVRALVNVADAMRPPDTD